MHVLKSYLLHFILHKQNILKFCSFLSVLNHIPIFVMCSCCHFNSIEGIQYKRLVKLMMNIFILLKSHHDLIYDEKIFSCSLTLVEIQELCIRATN